MIHGHPQIKMFQDLFDRCLIFDKRYYFHGTIAFGAEEGEC